MIPLTYFTYAVSGLHFGMWIQRPVWSLLPLLIGHLFVWLVFGRGEVGAAVFWAVRPGVYFLGAIVAHFYFILFGSPIAHWRVSPLTCEKVPSILTKRPREILFILATMSVKHFQAKGTSVPRRKLPCLPSTDLWPLHIAVDQADLPGHIRKPPAHFTIQDEQRPGHHGHSFYLLSLTPGHQVLAELFVLHSVLLVCALLFWEFWPPHSSREPWGFLGFLFIYTAATMWMGRLCRWGESKLWVHPIKASAFWVSWMVMATVLSTMAGGLAFVNALNEYWSGAIIPLGAVALVIPLLYVIWCAEATKITKNRVETEPFVASVSHATHPIRNAVGGHAAIIATVPQ